MEQLLDDIESNQDNWCEKYFNFYWQMESCDDTKDTYEQDVLLLQNYTAQLKYRESLGENHWNHT